MIDKQKIKQKVMDKLVELSEETESLDKISLIDFIVSQTIDEVKRSIITADMLPYNEEIIRVFKQNPVTMTLTTKQFIEYLNLDYGSIPYEEVRLFSLRLKQAQNSFKRLLK